MAPAGAPAAFPPHCTHRTGGGGTAPAFVRSGGPACGRRGGPRRNSGGAPFGAAAAAPAAPAAGAAAAAPSPSYLPGGGRRWCCRGPRGWRGGRRTWLPRRRPRQQWGRARGRSRGRRHRRPPGTGGGGRHRLPPLHLPGAGRRRGASRRRARRAGPARGRRGGGGSGSRRRRHNYCHYHCWWAVGHCRCRPCVGSCDGRRGGGRRGHGRDCGGGGSRCSGAAAAPGRRPDVDDRIDGGKEAPPPCRPWGVAAADTGHASP